MSKSKEEIIKQCAERLINARNIEFETISVIEYISNLTYGIPRKGISDRLKIEILEGVKDIISSPQMIKEALESAYLMKSVATTMAYLKPATTEIEKEVNRLQQTVTKKK